MPVEIIITGETAVQAMYEVREMSGLFGRPWAGLQPPTLADDQTQGVERRTEVATQEPVVETVTFTPATGAITANAAEPTKPKGRTKKETPAPVVQEDPPEVQAQDAADEAAEVAAAAPAEPARVYTYEDVRAALSGYVKKYGLPAVQEDGLKIYESIQPGAKKVSDFPADSAVLAKVVAAVEKVIAENPYNRPTVGA